MITKTPEGNNFASTDKNKKAKERIEINGSNGVWNNNEDSKGYTNKQKGDKHYKNKEKTNIFNSMKKKIFSAQICILKPLNKLIE